MTKAQEINAIRRAYMTAIRAMMDGVSPYEATRGLQAVLTLIAAERRDAKRKEVAA